MYNPDMSSVVEMPEDNPDMSSVVEMPEEKATARNPEFLQKWKKIFVASCLFAFLLDPLFLYIPMMKDDIKCLQSDRNLKIAALLLRSFVDLFYIFDIIVQVYTSDKFWDLIVEYRRRQNHTSEYAYCRRIRRKITFWSKYLVPIAKTMWGSYVILIDILVILPLPQVAILIFFSKMKDLRSLNTIRMVIMNLFVLLQYVPRLLHIYLSRKEFKRNLKGDIRGTPIWIKGVLNFFMYILASHVFGAMWYFFAIQRVGICWHDACRKEKGCSASTFSCHDHHTFRNIAFLNDLCPISPMNATLFDFGIYSKVLQSGIPGSTNYFQKFSNCFWLGLRHLSSFGSNLEPSIDGWENLFVAFISIIGLLLFLYLMGNLQLHTARIEEHRHNIKVKQKMEKKDKETELWLSKNGIPRRLNKDIKPQIMEKVRQELEENRDSDLDYIFSSLPFDLQSQFKRYMPMARLKQVPMFRNVDEIVLKATCGHLRPMEYVENQIITREGEQLEMMLFIVDGRVTIEHIDGSPNNLQQRVGGEVCGEELLDWPFPDEFPLALESATAIGDVEALVLMAEDLKIVVDKFLMHYISNKKSQMEEKDRETELWLSANGIPKRLLKAVKLKIMKKVRQELEENRDADLDHILSILPKNLESQITKYMPMTRLKQVPMLQNMDERVLSKICQYLEPREFEENSIIIEKGEPLTMMLFIVDGLVTIEKRDSSSSSSDNNLQQRGAGEVCGEEFLLWPLSFSFLVSRLTLATESAKATSQVEALVLTDIGLEGVAHRDYFVGMMRRTFSAKELEKATDNYHQSRIIRMDEDATFYKGVLDFCVFQKIVMKVQLKSEKCRDQALKIAKVAKGVSKVSIEVEKEHVEVIGDGIDAADLADSLKERLGYASIVSVQEVKKPDDAKPVVPILVMPDDDKTVVAVKKYTSMHINVAVEAAVASQTNHINVVKFLGGCVEQEKESALVFEYIPNGTLFEHIHKEEAAGCLPLDNRKQLSLELRLKIASEIARALAFLHSLTPPIIHLFLSTNHILLDDHYTAKLSAIGQSQAALWRLRSLINSISTQEYCDPNFQEDRLAEKTDVYAFGVILAELLTSQKPASPNSEGEEPPLATCLLSSMEKGCLNQILDGEIIFNEATYETAEKVADLAKRCLRSKKKKGPSMEQVAAELAGLRKFMAEYQKGEPSFSNRPTSLQP